MVERKQEFKQDSVKAKIEASEVFKAVSGQRAEVRVVYTYEQEDSTPPSQVVMTITHKKNATSGSFIKNLTINSYDVALADIYPEIDNKCKELMQWQEVQEEIPVTE